MALPISHFNINKMPVLDEEVPAEDKAHGPLGPNTGIFCMLLYSLWSMVVAIIITSPTT